jgi:hypothetical protein
MERNAEIELSPRACNYAGAALLAPNLIAATTASATGYFGHRFEPPDPCRGGCGAGGYDPPEPTFRRYYPPQPTMRRDFPPQPTMQRY